VEGDLRREVQADIRRKIEDRLLTRACGTPRPAGARPADQDQCAHPQGPKRTIAGKKKAR